MGAWGAIIMSFFGALFASLTLAFELHWTGIMLGLPFLGFVAIAAAAGLALRSPGEGIAPSKQAERVIMWSSIAEGVGLFAAAQVTISLGHREMLLPAMALVVGLHFLPMAHAIPFRPFYGLGIALLAASAAGFAVGGVTGAEVAGFAGTVALWIAAILAVGRERQARAAA
jgi:hypothetical protein